MLIKEEVHSSPMYELLVGSKLIDHIIIYGKYCIKMLCLSALYGHNLSLDVTLVISKVISKLRS